MHDESTKPTKKIAFLRNINFKGLNNLKGKMPKVNVKLLILLVALLVVSVTAYYAKGFFVAAVVNGQPISRITLITEIEKQGGKQVLETMVTKSLINQEAQKNNIVVSTEEIDAELAQIETTTMAQGMTLDQALAAQNFSRERLIEEIKLNKVLEKLVDGKVGVTDEEVTAYIEANKDFLPKDEDPAVTKESVTATLKQQKMSQEVQTLLTTLRQNAKITYFVNYN